MELLIVRHAIAFPRDAGRWPDDTGRPLTVEGVKRARRAAAGLKRIVKRPTLVLTSPLVRARETALYFPKSFPESACTKESSRLEENARPTSRNVARTCARPRSSTTTSR